MLSRNVSDENREIGVHLRSCSQTWDDERLFVAQTYAFDHNSEGLLPL